MSSEHLYWQVKCEAAGLESMAMEGKCRAATFERERAQQESERSIAYTMNVRLSIDGDKWCCLFGENLQDGVTGFGDSPAEAYDDFNTNWYKKLDKK